ncbi:PAS domain-containing protein [Bacillus sp. FJAT-27445]|uniref:PAS domain-containing protein n=1 Tax=Bacillus sp. FJAT-27445 TaxID=1679166 RepID=UPI00074419F3|nr:PAS domain-containing protein [Bacillus sp. FJAT-27445]
MLDRFLNGISAHYLLNKINENILIANSDYHIVWINDAAKQLLKKIGPFVGIENPEDFIGMSLTRFHGEREQMILEKGQFPHSAQISLFRTFSANIVVDRLDDENGVMIGYILTWKDVTEYETAIKEGREQLIELEIPIIPMAIEQIVLVPILGKLDDERLARMELKVLSYCAEHQKESIMFDFSGVSAEINTHIAFRLKQMVNSLRLMGIEPIYIGIRPDMAKTIVNERISLGVKTFQSFNQGIRYMWKKYGYTLVETIE